MALFGIGRRAAPDAAVLARLAVLRGILPRVVAEPDGDALDPGREPSALDPGRRGLAALVLLAGVAAAVTGWFGWRARPRELAVAPLRVAPSAAAALVVDVAGAVRRPGIVRLPDGARVVDAIQAAGGLLPGATTAGINLARRLADGEQILVGAGPPGSSGPSGAVAGKLDLNLATVAQLDALPGLGPVLAERIVQWRTAHGRFASVDQLREVPGIGARTFDSLKDLVTA